MSTNLKFCSVPELIERTQKHGNLDVVNDVTNPISTAQNRCTGSGVQKQSRNSLSLDQEAMVAGLESIVYASYG